MTTRSYLIIVTGGANSTFLEEVFAIFDTYRWYIPGLGQLTDFPDGSIVSW